MKLGTKFSILTSTLTILVVLGVSLFLYIAEKSLLIKEMKENVEFNLNKISIFSKVPNELIVDAKLNVWECGDNFLKNMLTARLDAYLFENQADERTLTYYCERPKFLDWLLRRKKRVEWKLIVKDLLLNPPRLKEKTTRIYLINE